MRRAKTAKPVLWLARVALPVSVQKHRIVSGEESDIHDEPHLEGHRITVRQIVERVEERGLDPGTVADRHNLPIADVYRALTYFYDHPGEMDAVYERKRKREEAARERGAPTLSEIADRQE
jgi:uncharacterized protein (DUF433 family)